jgi:hypothetical protein
MTIIRKLSAVKKPRINKSINGFILYDGVSILDNKPIVCIATLSSSNDKTGDMVQTWILRSDIHPVSATKTGDDISVCGNCIHRHYNNGACYVKTFQAPANVYKSYKKNNYPKYDPVLHSQYFMGRKIRLGAYGDPAAIPYEIFKNITDVTLGHTGYTHQVKHKNFDDRYLSLCQVSVDSPRQAEKYQKLGAKTFRVAMDGDSLLENEIECLADSQGIQCKDCMLCDGQKKNIAITVHGNLSGRFKTSIVKLVG